MIPKIKISGNTEKITTPGFKQVYRLFDRKTDKAIADVMTLAHEVIDDSKPYEIFDPKDTWKRQLVTDFYAKPLLEPIFKAGKLVYELPTLKEIVSYSQLQISHMWEEVQRFERPHRYYVDMSQELWDLRAGLLKKYSQKED